jgi:hypothetical protein
MGDIRRGWGVIRLVVGAAPVMMVDSGVQVNCILVKNLGPGTLWIYPDNTLTQAIGYPLGVNEALSIGIENRGAQEPERPILSVWGMSDASTNVAILTEDCVIGGPG